jgi:hypothetical protein
MLLFGGIGGTVSAFLQHGLLAAIIFFVAWSFIGVTIWQIIFVIIAAAVAAVVYGLVWLVHPDGWPVWLRWLMVVPAALVGYILATLLNIVFRYVALAFPFQNITAVISIFFVSFFQAAVAIFAAAWIAPTAKRTVSVVLSTLLCVVAIALVVIAQNSSEPLDVPRWAYLIACVLEAIGAVAAAVIVARLAATPTDSASSVV